MDGPRWLDERELRVWTTYLRLQRDLTNALEGQTLRDFGLSGADYAVLAALSDSPCGLLRTKELGLTMGWERSRLSHQVSRMEKRGLVARNECGEDARGSMVVITDAGRTAIAAAAPVHVETVRRYFFDQLSADERETLGTLFARMVAGLEADKPCKPC